MNKLLIALAFAAGGLLHISVLAQDAGAGDALYKALGEKAGISRIADDFVGRMVARPLEFGREGDARRGRVLVARDGRHCRVATQ